MVRASASASERHFRSITKQRRHTMVKSRVTHSLLSRAATLLSVIAALLLLIPSLAQAWNNDVKVKTAYGSLQGYVSGDGAVMIWQGVPYARPPVDDPANHVYLRWKAPQPPVPWQGVRAATVPAPKCTQLYTTDDWVRTGVIDKDSSEDCLYVNILRPNNSKRLPVDRKSTRLNSSHHSISY